MAKEFQIFWSPEAEETYLKAISFILEKWTIREAEDFEKMVESLLERLKTHKHLCPPSTKHKKLRKCVVSYQTSIIYRVVSDTIEIVTFIDNRSGHNF